MLNFAIVVPCRVSACGSKPPVEITFLNISSFIFALWFGAGAGLVIYGLIRTRHLQKLGFTGRELFFKEAFYRKLAKITVEKLPQEISFKPIESHHWSNGSEYTGGVAALEALGFERQHVFLASPQKWVVEMWLSKNDGLFAAILDARRVESTPRWSWNIKMALQ